jgi:hypothetical protein
MQVRKPSVLQELLVCFSVGEATVSTLVTEVANFAKSVLNIYQTKGVTSR